MSREVDTLVVNNIPTHHGFGHCIGRRLFFMHIPKTAGTTVGELLSDWFAVDDIMPTHEACEQFANHPNRGLAAHHYQLFGLGVHHDHDFIEAFKHSLDISEKPPVIFTILREPRDRLISQYQYWLRADEQELSLLPPAVRSAYHKAQSQSLYDFLENADHIILEHFQNCQLRYLAGISNIRYLSDQALLDRALSNLYSYDLVGTLTTLDQAIHTLAHAYGCPPPAMLRPTNVSPLKSSNRYDTRTEEAIQRFLDVELRFWHLVFGHTHSSQTRPASSNNYYRPSRHQLETLLSLGVFKTSMKDRLCGTGWHIREGMNRDVRWTGPSTSSTMQIMVPNSRHIKICLMIISVLDWRIVEGTHLRLDGISPSSLMQVNTTTGMPTLEAHFDLDNPSTSMRELQINVPYTLSNYDLDPISTDTRQKGFAIGEITASAMPVDYPRYLADVLWSIPDHPEMTTVDFCLQQLKPQCKRTDLETMGHLISLLGPAHITIVGSDYPFNQLSAFARVEPECQRLLVISSPQSLMQAAPINELVHRSDPVILVLDRARDLRLRILSSHPSIADSMVFIDLNDGLLLINLSKIENRLGGDMLDAFLWLIQRVGATEYSSLGQNTSLMECHHVDRQLRIAVDAVLDQFRFCTRERIDRQPVKILKSLMPEHISAPTLEELVYEYHSSDCCRPDPSITSLSVDEIFKSLDSIAKLPLGSAERLLASLVSLKQVWDELESASTAFKVLA